MHFKTLKNKKAVSPIIATLLLILIAVAAGVIIYIWTTSYIGTQIGTASGQETFVITKVKYVDGNDNETDVTIINQGATAINIKSVIVYDSTYTNIQAKNKTISPTTTINPGDTQTLNVKLNNPLSKGVSYVLEVTTEKGYTAVYRFTA